MAKRIQMRKQRFTAVQKMAVEKKIQIDGPPGPSEPLPPPRTSTLSRPLPPSRSSVRKIKAKNNPRDKLINRYTKRNCVYRKEDLRHMTQNLILRVAPWRILLMEHEQPYLDPHRSPTKKQEDNPN